ncbi:MAG: LysM peptidoglycan-binding domain-containing protein [Dehalococcoidia bacterium]
MNTQKQIVLIVALMFIFVGGCAAYSAIELPVRAPDQTQWTKDQSLERGALLFANNCRTCHGNMGQGGVGPQLLNNPDSQFQDQDPLKLAANRALITRTLSCGRAGTLMPAWLNTNGGSLNAIQIQHLVDFLTSPIEVNDQGDATSQWWEEAVNFSHNLNGEVTALVGGDTLETIAKSHGIGPKELAALNNLPIEGLIKKGTELQIPGGKDFKGYTYTVYKTNETITKIAEAQYVGAVILADLNGLNYELTEKRGVATFQLKTEEGKDITGLFPGAELKLPDGATYTVQSGDTIDALAKRHGISASELKNLNKDLLGDLANDDEIPFERRLALPKQVVIVQDGDTLGTIAQQHGIEVADLAAENQLAEDAVVDVGTELKLPVDAEYIVQAGDTWGLAATIHGTTADELAAKNNAKSSDPLKPDVILQLPKIDKYVVQGQNLEDVAKGYGNVTADSLATANGLEANSILAVGTALELPQDAFGTSPPDAKNPGTACVQYAVPANVFDEISGNTTPVTKPPTASSSVKVDAHANDWTVTADGAAQPANKGVVLIPKGTSVSFESIVGLHTITVNGEKDDGDLTQGSSRTLTFNTAGEFAITCDYHPPMHATFFVE